jgi:hypothetical protein
MVASLFKCLGTAMVLVISPLSATTLFTTGSVPPSFDNLSVNAWDILPSGIQAVALEFNPSVTSVFGQIELPLASVSGSGSVVVELMTNSGGAPGSVIESWTPSIGSTSAMVTVSSAVLPTLKHGTNYWVAVTTTGSLEVNWFTTTTNIRGADLFLGSWVSSSGSTKPAVAVLSFAAPEPSTGGLASAALLAVLVALRQKTKLLKSLEMRRVCRHEPEPHALGILLQLGNLTRVLPDLAKREPCGKL